MKALFMAVTWYQMGNPVCFICVTHWVDFTVFIPWHLFPLSLLITSVPPQFVAPCDLLPRTHRKRESSVLREKKRYPQLLSKQPEQPDRYVGTICGTGRSGSVQGYMRQEANPVPPPRFSGWDESHLANNVFDFAVSSRQVWRERADASCLTDLHTVFTCPAAVLVGTLAGDSSLTVNNPTH